MARTLAMYSDIQRVLDAALAAGGGTYRCPAHGTAVHWRQRAYAFRKLFRETMSAHHSPYDTLTFKKVEEGSCEVIIAVIETPGKFIPNNEAPAPEEDELLAEAQALAEKLDGGIL